MTLNLLQPSLINPKLSANSQVFGELNYDRTPMSSPGITFIIRVTHALAITVIY